MLVLIELHSTFCAQAVQGDPKEPVDVEKMMERRRQAQLEAEAMSKAEKEKRAAEGTRLLVGWWCSFLLGQADSQEQKRNVRSVTKPSRWAFHD